VNDTALDALTKGAAASAGGGVNRLSETVATEFRSIAWVTLQLLLALAVVGQYQLESRTFFEVFALACGGFVVHSLLPLRFRLPFFCALSLASLVVALGPIDGLAVVGLGVVLIAVCHLPLGLGPRICLLLSTGALFALWRVQVLDSPVSGVVWPILGSMFMFRVALYLHSLRFDAHRPRPTQTFAYFFMSPNVCFPLFPVVDFATFVRTYYDRAPGLIYESGMKWLARGLLHLILYRCVYLYFAGQDPAELRDLGDVVQFVLATFLLYLRVSGQFHLIVGMLHLFGFRLPDTHHLYFLSSSFTDFWRRINIYWKDFMMKLVYYPSFFRLRRWGNDFALVSATIIVFAATWVLHSYQWFWLRGGFPLEPQDGLFWGVLAVLVVRGALREIAQPRKKSLGRAPMWDPSLAFRTLGTFAAICVLWSLWSADSVVAWLLIWPAAANVDGPGVMMLVALAAGFLFIAGHPWSLWENYDSKPRPFLQRPLVQSGATLGVLLALGSTAYYDRQAPLLAETMNGLRQTTLNARDASLQHKGYYENLDNTSRMSLQLWNVQAQKPEHWVGLSATDAYRSLDGFVSGELVPNARITFLDKPLTVNSQGMRDREHSVARPDRTYRIAQLGPSHVMGSGVADGETFSDFLEERLNQANYPDTDVVEVLNFGVAGTSLIYQLAVLSERASRFSPNVVIITDSPRSKETVAGAMLDLASSGVRIPFEEMEALMARTGIRRVSGGGIPLPFDWLRAIAARAGIETRMPWVEADRRARAAAGEMLRLTLARIVHTAREVGAVPVFLALDNVVAPPEDPVEVVRIASEVGFVVFDLLDLWKDRDMPPLRIAAWDNHPNAAGNRLVAERLHEEMLAHRRVLRFPEAE
jgi:D-alanyl-lipoteichoic acid acyltransferase DltB (MBOAT superfamily)